MSHILQCLTRQFATADTVICLQMFHLFSQLLQKQMTTKLDDDGEPQMDMAIDTPGVSSHEHNLGRTPHHDFIFQQYLHFLLEVKLLNGVCGGE